MFVANPRATIATRYASRFTDWLPFASPSGTDPLLAPPFAPLDVQPADIQVVLQREGAFVYADSAVPVAASYGAGPCVLVALYDPNSRAAFLAHVDADTHLPDIATAARTLRGPAPGPAPLQAHVIGGSGNVAFARRVLDQVKALPDTQLHSIWMDQKTPLGDALMIDARTGAISDARGAAIRATTPDHRADNHAHILAGPPHPAGGRCLRIVP